mmetsp:Transcript_46325/g.149298  ORF Transcript_46325/g.149298 Transcript_46325/m.149298 type:complete len:289 (+) Transcript_46325:203-1069(+)
MNGIARVRGPRRQWLSRSCHAREAVEAPLAHRDVAHVGQRQLLLRPDARARHRHEKARPQRVAARRGVHHLGKGDVGLGGVGGRGARVAKAAVGVVGPPDDDVAAALARDGVYGAGQIAGNLPLPVHAPPHAAHRHRAVCDLDRPAQVGLLERGLHPAATDGTGRNREEGGQPRRAEHPVHPRDVARVLRGEHQLQPRALSYPEITSEIGRGLDERSTSCDLVRSPPRGSSSLLFGWISASTSRLPSASCTRASETTRCTECTCGRSSSRSISSSAKIAVKPAAGMSV